MIRCRRYMRRRECDADAAGMSTADEDGRLIDSAVRDRLVRASRWQGCRPVALPRFADDPFPLPSFASLSKITAISSALSQGNGLLVRTRAASRLKSGGLTTVEPNRVTPLQYRRMTTVVPESIGALTFSAACSKRG